MLPSNQKDLKERFDGNEKIAVHHKPNGKGNSKMKKLRVIDFQNEKGATAKIEAILAETDATVDDWMEKDHGIVVFCLVPNETAEKFISLIGNVHGATYDGPWGE